MGEGTVFIRKTDYTYSRLQPAFGGIMDAIGGGRIRSGDRVLIKPNLLCPATPPQAVLTHPLIVRAAVEYCLEKGARPRVGDSPAMGTFGKVMKDSGIREALRGIDVPCGPFVKSVRVDIGPPFGAIEMAEDFLEADWVVNLPKLKTHGQMLLTLGVKNLFGCVIGHRKPEWHMRAGVDRERFAQLLVRIYERVRPAFTVLDGILALEGNGPGKGGVPREVGVLMGSVDGHAVDGTVCRILGVEADRLPTLKAARALGLLNDAVDIDGELPRVHGFKLPETETVLMGPRLLHGFARRHLLQRPMADPALCRLCGECWKICPAGAVAQEGEGLRFDYDRCIRCYCCIEVCPFGALHPVETVPGRFIRRLVKRYF